MTDDGKQTTVNLSNIKLESQRVNTWSRGS